jgi:hypothetical protein
MISGPFNTNVNTRAAQSTYREPPEQAKFAQHFLGRLVAVADAGSLFDVDKTMKLLDLPYTAEASQTVPQPPDCSVEWRPKILWVTSVSLEEGQAWFKPTQYGAGIDQVPTYQQQGREAYVMPRFGYTLTHGVRCGDSPFIQDYTEARIVLGISAYSCVTKADLAAAIPKISLVGALGVGPTRYVYRAHTDDDSGTNVRVNFDYRYPCALSVEIEQTQQ